MDVTVVTVVAGDTAVVVMVVTIVEVMIPTVAGATLISGAGAEAAKASNEAIKPTVLRTYMADYLDNNCWLGTICPHTGACTSVTS
jgi:hypothetical protein